jgi:23S rRNA (adenine2503-C2)-methyltransferase
MQPKPSLFSVCVSCEVGCPMACAFCATGKMGFTRPLTAKKSDQWVYWVNYLAASNQKPSHIVFMGMGEPFHNQTAVFEAVSHFTDPESYHIGDRKISISTCGVIPGILALSESFPQVNLAISLHAARKEVRESLMPISKAYSLQELQTCLIQYAKKTRRQIMLEYLLLKGINDRPTDLQSLVDWLKPFPKGLAHVNLIRFNPSGTNFEAPEILVVNWWKKTLLQARVSISIRKNLGADIFGACGQLAVSKTKPTLPAG